MAADKATLITDLQAAFNAGIGQDDNALQISTDIANAIDTYAKTLKGTADSGGPTPMLDSLGGPVEGTTSID